MNLNQEALAKLGTRLRAKFEQFQKDRQPLEQQWIKNLRQYLGKYDPEIESKIPQERSHVYPRDTRVKVKGFVAKMMEMMFPASERNWELGVSPVPSIDEDDLQDIIAQMEDAEDMAARQEQRDPRELTDEEIEKAVMAFAQKRKDAMEREIADQLADSETDYTQIAKRAVRSGAIFGLGIAKSPLVRRQKERVFEKDPATGRFKAIVKTKRRPYPEFLKVWDAYPDLSARVWEEQEGFFERVVLPRHRLYELSKRDDFIKGNIRDYLRNHQQGNYKAQTYESDLQNLRHGDNLADREGRLYELFKYTGFITAHEARDAGVEVADSEMDTEVFGEVWLLDDIVVKALKAPFGERVSDLYHPFIYAEDEDSGLAGVGMPEELRDSQMTLCASTRALLDNMATTAGPIFEVNKSLLAPGQDLTTIHSFKVFIRDDESPQTTNAPAVRDITVQSRIPEILSVIEKTRAQLDLESNLPQWTFGNVQNLGEGMRTSYNMSQMTGGANMVTKDVVRSFDRFTTSLVGSFLKWNMEFGDDDLKGDFEVRAKGNISLVAKEVRGAALDQFMQTLSEQERALLDTHGLLIDRLKLRDLPIDRVVTKEQAEAILKGMAQQAQQAQSVEQGLTQAKTDKTTADAEKSRVEALTKTQMTDAMIAEMISRIESSQKKSANDADKVQLENMRVLLDAIRQDSGNEAIAQQGGAAM